MSHTQGPWKAENDYGRHWISAGKGRKRIDIATVQDIETGKRSGEVDTDVETTAANAKLLAAAPDLLEAAQDAVTDLELATEGHATVCRCANCVTVMRLHAAIRKAKGE